MAAIEVYWRISDFDPEEQSKQRGEVVLTGILTDEHEAASPEEPVVVEEESARVYRAGQLPPEAVLYIEDAPGPFPHLAQVAALAGFQVEHARNDPGMADRPRGRLAEENPEEEGERRREWY
jgi:hypothetical protein